MSFVIALCFLLLFFSFFFGAVALGRGVDFTQTNFIHTVCYYGKRFSLDLLNAIVSSFNFSILDYSCQKF